jgi:hypothetical protein
MSSEVRLAPDVGANEAVAFNKGCMHDDSDWSALSCPRKVEQLAEMPLGMRVVFCT